MLYLVNPKGVTYGKRQKRKFPVHVLFEALYSRESRPNELSHLAENQIVKAIIVYLRSSKRDKDIVCATEQQLWEVVGSDECNPLGRRRGLIYFIRRKNRNKLSEDLAIKVNDFCEKNSTLDWVKSALMRV